MMKEMTLEEMRETMGGETENHMGLHPYQKFDFWDLVELCGHNDYGPGRVIVPGDEKSFVVFKDVNGLILNQHLVKIGRHDT